MRLFCDFSYLQRWQIKINLLSAKLGKIIISNSAVILFICIFAIFLFPVPTFAVTNEPITLTWELLQERVKTPILRDGNLTVDLKKMVIDLRPENAIFRDNFYQLLRKELQRTGATALGLDLSNSVIEGDFYGSDLGLRTPLYAQ